jgi:hypothetical protein
MEQIPLAEMERTMKVQEVILQAMAKKITWWQAGDPGSEQQNDATVEMELRAPWV